MGAELQQLSIPMKTGVWILGDQLWHEQAALVACAGDRARVPVIAIESLAHVRQRPYHAQKLVLVWSAMRHFVRELQDMGWPATWAEAEDFATPLRAWVIKHQIDRLLVMAPVDRPFQQILNQLDLPCKLEQIPNNQFLWSEEELADWFGSRKRFLMEDFYREGRKRFQILMEGSKPVGGQWNFDKDNRQPPKGPLHPPAPLEFAPNEIVLTVIEKVRSLDLPTYGSIDSFRWATTRSRALDVLDHFIAHRLRTFGPYQDAMVTGQDTLWHALLSPYLNLGLLHPREVIFAAEKAWRDRGLPIASVEGFIRQVLGWREYMRGIYLQVLKADEEPPYPDRNWFNHQHALPQWFWDGNTDLNCLRQVLQQVDRTGYAHHIQRLMVLSNFALIAGLNPQEVENWFHAVFIDAYDWVMQTNVLGMGLFADGGVLASKPYAASANYINRMSDYCKGCRYNPRDRTGPKACPFNFFYWDFLARHESKLRSQGRMSLILKHLEKIPAEEMAAIRALSVAWHRQQQLLNE